ncbi:MAG TPA: 1-(5-phosphoribosyl)-5-[(5-phosphoribosylamino)methylideneamino]imidazole-4-carboxamide isomerase [Clostridiaceae bacterium]|nr:1-(5-phosphoribosyl)-5-[(5-phosphoribosylamino)methylideneamino]imidazole-4-carboxamide isomerase [Clostridiaceae bacterium]
MIIYPAIDLLDGKCVRLYRGDYNKVTEYSNDPVQVAKAIADIGATWLHVVDLNAARTGESYNRDIIKKIVAETGLHVQTGGGIRSLATVEALLDIGVARCVIGTAAVRDSEFAQTVLQKYSDQTAVGIDSRDGKVRVAGWTEDSGIDTLSLALQMKEWGAVTIIYTDISRDGALSGPAIASSRELMEQTGLDVIVSGGISSNSDINECRRIGAAGVIVGKALYERKVDLKKCFQNG